MHDRREFIKITAAAGCVMAFNSTPEVFAQNKPLYTNIIYTRDNPGKWEKKVDSHAPEMTINGDKVEVVTKHPMSDTHFIVRHTLVLEDGTYVGAATFTPADKPQSSYSLPKGYKGKVYVTSFCNQHDFWLTETTV